MNGNESTTPTTDADPITASRDVGLDRTRALRRGAIMGLSRDRSWHFEPTRREVLIRAIASLGLLVPLWFTGIVARWLGLEWQLIPASLRAAREGSSGTDFDMLIRFADDHSMAISRAIDRLGVWVWACALAGLGVIVHGLGSGAGWSIAFAPIWSEGSLAWHHLLLVVMILLAGAGIVRVRWMHTRALGRTIDGINAILIARSIRPIGKSPRLSDASTASTHGSTSATKEIDGSITGRSRGATMWGFLSLVTLLTLAAGTWWLLACVIAYADVMSEVRGQSADFRAGWAGRLRQILPTDGLTLPSEGSLLPVEG